MNNVMYVEHKTYFDNYVIDNIIIVINSITVKLKNIIIFEPKTSFVNRMIVVINY